MPGEDAFNRWYETAVIENANGSKGRVCVLMDRWVAKAVWDAGWEANNLQPYYELG